MPLAEPRKQQAPAEDRERSLLALFQSGLLSAGALEEALTALREQAEAAKLEARRDAARGRVASLREAVMRAATPSERRALLEELMVRVTMSGRRFVCHLGSAGVACSSGGA